jgi:hypothetical protein
MKAEWGTQTKETFSSISNTCCKSWKRPSLAPNFGSGKIKQDPHSSFDDIALLTLLDKYSRAFKFV